MASTTPQEIAGHIVQARDLLVRARDHLGDGDLHRASEEGWRRLAPWPRAGSTNGTATFTG